MSDQLSMEGLAVRVMAVIAKTQRIPPESLSIDSSFEELKIDSLDGINIIFAIENEFGVNIPDEGVQNLKTVRQVVEGVHDLLQKKVLLQTSDAPAPGAA
jgi:acyl carrier protein